MHLRYLDYFYAAPDSGAGVAPPEEDRSTLDILMEETPDEQPIKEDTFTTPIEGEEKETVEEEATAEEKPEELKIEDIEEELEIKPEDLGFTQPVIRKELLTAYPDIFKKFPHLEKAIYREKEYGSLFPTIEDAKIVVDKANLLESYQGDVLNGNLEPLLKTVKEANPSGFGKLVDNYFAVLDRVDPYARLHVIGNIGKQIIYEMGVQGQQLNNENLKGAAVILHQFLFANNQFTPPQPFSKEQPAQNQELEQQKAALLQNQFQTVLIDEYTRASGAIRAAIEKNIDPKNSMPEFVKTTAIEKCIETVEKAIVSDSRFRGYMNSLWQRAHESNYSAASRNKIRTAYLSKAQSVLGQSIQVTRQAALKGLGPNSRPDKDRSGPVAQGRSPSNSGGNRQITKASQIPRTMSTRDFIMSDD